MISITEQAFREFVDNPAFSCLAGKGAVNSGGCVIKTYGALGSAQAARPLAGDLERYVRELQNETTTLTAFVAIFTEQAPEDEIAFEDKLWEQLRQVRALDPGSEPIAPGTSDDPDDPTFAFNFRGTAMFLVGLHPMASRISRRFRWPALVFNPHKQFERLREMNRFERLRSIVREREVALQGSLNPNLADFGERSEARQYSGRQVEEDWRCPFHHKP